MEIILKMKKIWYLPRPINTLEYLRKLCVSNIFHNGNEGGGYQEKADDCNNL